MAIRPNTWELTRLRNERRWTQKDVALRLRQLGLGISDNHYSRIERGVEGYTNIQLETAFAIAHIYETTVENLFQYIPEVQDIKIETSADRLDAQQELKDNKKKWGKALKELRKKKNKTAQEVAEWLEVSTPYVYQMERGNGAEDKFEGYAGILGTTLDELMGKPKATLDRYCLECGESVDMKAGKCHYCGSDKLDTMEIEPEEL